MKQSVTNSYSFLTTLEPNLSIEERNALQAVAPELHYINDKTVTDGVIYDSKTVVQGLNNDYKKITGKDLLKNTILIWLLIVCLFTHNLLNWYQITGSGVGRQATTLYNDKNEKFTKTSPDSNNSYSININNYYKTHEPVRKNTHIFISAHGTLYFPSGNITCTAEGIPADNINNIYDPLIEQYNSGALLFRFGANDHWKPYSSTQNKIIVDKDGVLEFTINLKIPDKVTGSYSVDISR